MASPAVPPRLEHEIVRRQRPRPGELDLEVDVLVAVEVRLDDRLAALMGVVELAPDAGELGALVHLEDELAVARGAAVGVDGREVDAVGDRA